MAILKKPMCSSKNRCALQKTDVLFASDKWLNAPPETREPWVMISQTFKEVRHHEAKPSPPCLEYLRRSGPSKTKLIVIESPLHFDAPFLFG